MQKKQKPHTKKMTRSKKSSARKIKLPQEKSSLMGLFVFIGIAVCSLIWALSTGSGLNKSLDAGSANLIATTTKDPPKECFTCEAHPAAVEEEPPFIDVPVTHQYYKAIKYLKEMGVAKGSPDGKFNPNDYLKRAEVMTMVVRALKIETNELNGSNCFDDVKTEWFAPYICYGKMRGWISGVTPVTFDPNGLVQRAEAWKIVLGGFAIKLDGELNPEFKAKGPKDVNSAQWYAKYVYTIYNKGWLTATYYRNPNDLINKFIEGDTKENKFGDNHYFYPAQWVERGELAQMLYMVMHDAAPTI